MASIVYYVRCEVLSKLTKKNNVFQQHCVVQQKLSNVTSSVYSLSLHTYKYRLLRVQKVKLPLPIL